MKFFSKFKNYPKQSPDVFAPPPADESAPQIVETKPSEKPLETNEMPAVTAAETFVESPPEVVASRKIIEVEFPQFTMQALLAKMIEIGASDLHLESGSEPAYRIRGDMYYTNLEPISIETTEKFLFSLINDTQKQIFLELGNVDFSYEMKKIARFRANFLKHNRGLGGVFRIIPSKIPTVEQLGLPEVLKSIAMSRKGIILVTGPTGSGKSTTMAAMINYINQNRKGHIITIEDPIEFTHQSVNCLISHREVGLHTRSFSDALRAALREDPDVILVGEMRDLETVSLALTAAQMGVLVMGTLHTNSATKTIDRMIDVFPARQQEQVRIQLSQSLRAIIAQQLLKTSDERGRVAALEILIANIGLSNIIREGKTTQISSFIQMGKNEGMQSMDSILIELVKEGRIRKEDALLRAHDLSNYKRAGLI